MLFTYLAELQVLQQVWILGFETLHHSENKQHNPLKSVFSLCAALMRETLCFSCV